MAMKIDTRIAYDLHIEIARPSAQVFAAFTHVPAIPKWVKPVKSIRDFSGLPIGKDTTYTQVSVFLAKEFTTDIEITNFVPGKLVKYEHSGPVSGEMLVTFSDIAGGALLNMVFSGKTDGFFGINAPLLKTIIQKQTTSDLKALKDVLER